MRRSGKRHWAVPAMELVMPKPRISLHFHRDNPADRPKIDMVYMYWFRLLPFYVGEVSARRLAPRHRDHLQHWQTNQHTFLRPEFYNFGDGDDAPAAFVARLRQVLASADRARSVFINGIDLWTTEIADEAQAFCATACDFLVAPVSGTSPHRRVVESRIQQDLKDHFDSLMEGGRNWHYTKSAEVFGKQALAAGRPELDFIIEYGFADEPFCEAREFFTKLPAWLRRTLADPARPTSPRPS
jgi:hypothetical protein